MMDLQLAFDGTLLTGDLVQAGAGLALDDTLQTAVVISLFSDRRAEADDALPAGESNRRGWWGDLLADVPNDRTGSKLWLRAREKQLAAVLRQFEDDARQALAWLVEDGLAARVDVTATNPAFGVWHLDVQIRRPDGTAEEYGFDRLYGRSG